MPLKLYNTLTRQKEIFEPLDTNNIKMYLCGPTVYDLPHLGNGRSAMAFDVLYRVLSYLYPKVTYARNFTDIDDKIIAASCANNEPISSLTKRTEKAYLEDMAAVNVLVPSLQPRATENIPEMIALIEKLIQSDHAYAADGHVLFHVPSMPHYGVLSRQNREDMIAGARVEVAPYKKDPADFILWKPSTSDQPGWPSPWGRGRPGWHIECTAMIQAHLGKTIDIHAGGQDLIFPHHENEIAQGTCAYKNEPFVRYWVHNGMLIVNGEKMSKSLGNFFTIREMLEKVPGEAIRFYMMGTHYRQPFDFHVDRLLNAKQILDRFYLALREVESIPFDPNCSIPVEVLEAFEDDLNTPLVLTYMHEYLSALNKSAEEKEKRKYKTLLLKSGNLIGVLQQDPDSWFRWGMGLSAETIELKLQERADARKNKDFQKADAIRNWLKDHQIEIEDTSTGTKWRGR